MTTPVPSVATFFDEDESARHDPAQNPSVAAAFWLRRDIVRGVFAPGERIKVERLVSFYKLGQSPIREAIAIVASSGLVIHEHLKGSRVAPVSLADYADLVEIYHRLYKLALEMAVERGDDAWEERVVVQLHRSLKLRLAATNDDPEAHERWQRNYWRFHGALLSGSGSPLLLRLVADIGYRVERYVNLFAIRESERLRDRADEHRQIVDAVIERDKARVLALVEAYFAMVQPMRNKIIAALQLVETAGSPARVVAGLVA